MSASTSTSTPWSPRSNKARIDAKAPQAPATVTPITACDPASADELPIAGIMPFSATDWPGKLTVTVFTQGCPLACVYCHNAQLREFRAGSEKFSEALALLRERKGLYDGLVISGGEPTASPHLPAAIAAAHAEGLAVGLHTCGYQPRRITALLRSPETTPDWVGFDAKALPEHFPAVTGGTLRMAGGNWESLRLLSEAGVDMQVRTTLWPGSVIERHLDELRERVANLGHELVVQYARGVDREGRYAS